VRFSPSDNITVSLTTANPIEWCDVTTGRMNNCYRSNNNSLNEVIYPHRINGITGKYLDFNRYSEKSNKLPKNSTY
jgi:hypothetical protein